MNRGILEAYEAGTVTSASLLAGAPGFADAVTRLGSAPGLAVGLHLNLTQGAPVSPREAVPTLWDARTGAFYPLVRLVQRVLTGRLSPAHVAFECAAQLARLRAVGIRITHIDSHHHIHVLPGLWEPVLSVVRDAGIRGVRVPLEPVTGSGVQAAVKLSAVRLAWRVASRRQGGRDLRRSEHFRGMALLGARDFQARFLALLDGLGSGTTEVVVHPGYVDDDLVAWDHYTVPREQELAALCSAELRARLGRGDIELVRVARS